MRIISADSAAAILDEQFNARFLVASVSILVNPPYREPSYRLAEPIFREVESVYLYSLIWAEYDVRGFAVDVDDVLRKAKLNLLMNEWYCGFGTPDGKLPELSFSDVYVVKSADRNSQWYVDRYGCIHFDIKKQIFKDDVGLRSIRINTNEKGRYPLELVYFVIGNEYKGVKKAIVGKVIKHLWVKVE